MIAKVLTSYRGEAYSRTLAVLREAGIQVWTPQHFYHDIIICPDYERIIPGADLEMAEFGALVFHPSPLPRMRGRDAIKRQYKAGDRVGGGTWFWAGPGIDSGDICEQSVCLIDSSVRPSEYYNDVIIPIMCETLKRAIAGIFSGSPRAIPQVIVKRPKNGQDG